MVKEGKSLTRPTPWDETLEPSASVTKGKGLVEDKEENKDLLSVIWLVAPESKTQGPGEEDWVKPTKDVTVWATVVGKLLILIPFEKFVEHNKYIGWNRRDFRTEIDSGRYAASNGAWGTIKTIWSLVKTNTPMTTTRRRRWWRLR